MPGLPSASDTVTTRAALPQDVEGIANLSGQLGYPSSPDEVRERLGLLTMGHSDGVFVAEATGGSVVGWVHVARRHLVMVGEFAQIEGLVVDEAWRRSGVGQALVSAAEQWALSHGCRTIRVRSNVIRVAAHQFYERMGYQAVKQQVSYRKDLGTG